jgi:hypothetical protein
MQLVNVASIPRSEKTLKKANCLAGDAVGDCVRFTGPRVGGLYQVEKIDISDVDELPSIGIIIRKISATLCVVQCAGPMSGIYTGLVPNEVYFVGTDGRLAKDGDSNFPGAAQPLQQMGVASDTTELQLQPLDVGSLLSGSLLTQPKVQVLLVGVKDGVNREFTTPDYFLPDTIKVYHNGRRLLRSSSTPSFGNYVVSESGGAGTGFDTITLFFSPTPISGLFSDYTAIL